MAISKPFKGLATGNVSHENANQYTRVFYGDQNLCEQWITYAQTILTQMLMLPGTQTRHVMATPDVSVNVTCRPNRIEISAGGNNVFTTVADKYSNVGVYGLYNLPPYQTAEKRILFTDINSEFKKNNFYAGGNVLYGDYITSEVASSGEYYSIVLPYFFPTNLYLSGGSWYGYGNKYDDIPSPISKDSVFALSWTKVDADTYAFYIAGRFCVFTFASGVSFHTAVVINKTSALVTAYTSLNEYSKTMLVLCTDTGNVVLKIYGVNKISVDGFSMAYIGETIIYEPISSVDTISGFSKDAKRFAYFDRATDANGFTDTIYILSFSADYSSYTVETVYSETVDTISTEVTNKWTDVSEDEDGTFWVLSTSSSTSTLSGTSSPAIKWIKPDGDGFCALRAGMLSFSASSSIVYDVHESSGSSSSSGYIDVISFNNLESFSVVLTANVDFGNNNYTASGQVISNYDAYDSFTVKKHTEIYYYSAIEKIIILRDLSVTETLSGQTHSVVGTATYTDINDLVRYSTTTGDTSIATGGRSSITRTAYSTPVLPDLSYYTGGTPPETTVSTSAINCPVNMYNGNAASNGKLLVCGFYMTYYNPRALTDGWTIKFPLSNADGSIDGTKKIIINESINNLSGTPHDGDFTGGSADWLMLFTPISVTQLHW